MDEADADLYVNFGSKLARTLRPVDPVTQALAEKVKQAERDAAAAATAAQVAHREQIMASFGADTYPDGRVLLFHRQVSPDKTLSYAALKAGGKWWLTGAQLPQDMRGGLTWSRLVLSMVSGPNPVRQFEALGSGVVIPPTPVPDPAPASSDTSDSGRIINTVDQLNSLSVGARIAFRTKTAVMPDTAERAPSGLWVRGSDGRGFGPHALLNAYSQVWVIGTQTA